MSRKTFFVYGLQRSGTNFLTEFMKVNLGIEMKNNDLGDRGHISQKHFRLYDNKEIIPVKQYFNTILIEDYEQIKEMLGEKDLHCIVIRKDIFSWLTSIQRWAVKCDWEKKDKMDYIDDYIHFYKKWESFDSEHVLFVNYISLVTKNKETIKIIENFTGKKYVGVKVSDKLKCSGVFDSEKRKYYCKKQYMKEYSDEEIEFIKKKLSDASFSPSL